MSLGWKSQALDLSAELIRVWGQGINLCEEVGVLSGWRLEWAGALEGLTLN